jgi:hypothetical protein
MFRSFVNDRGGAETYGCLLMIATVLRSPELSDHEQKDDGDMYENASLQLNTRTRPSWHMTSFDNKIKGELQSKEVDVRSGR